MQKSSHSDIETKIKHIYDALISCDSAHTSLSLTAFDELILIKVLYIIRTKFHRKHQNVWGNPNKFSIIDPAIFVESCRGNLHGVSQKMADQFTRMCNGLEFHTRYSSPDMWAVLYPELNLRFGVFGDFFPWFEPSWAPILNKYSLNWHKKMSPATSREILERYSSGSLFSRFVLQCSRGNTIQHIQEIGTAGNIFDYRSSLNSAIARTEIIDLLKYLTLKHSKNQESDGQIHLAVRTKAAEIHKLVQLSETKDLLDYVDGRLRCLYPDHDKLWPNFHINTLQEKGFCIRRCVLFLIVLFARQTVWDTRIELGVSKIFGQSWSHFTRWVIKNSKHTVTRGRRSKYRKNLRQLMVSKSRLWRRHAKRNVRGPWKDSMKGVDAFWLLSNLSRWLGGLNFGFFLCHYTVHKNVQSCKIQHKSAQLCTTFSGIPNCGNHKLTKNRLVV